MNDKRTLHRADARSFHVHALFFLAAFALATSGCKLFKKDTGAVDAAAPEDTSSATASETDAATETADAAVAAITTARTADNIPPPQDPDIAAADITRTNFRSELDRLEKEVDTEK